MPALPSSRGPSEETEQSRKEPATPGDLVPNGEKTVVYLVTVKGHFAATAASVPAGADVPTGTYLSLVINAKTFARLDFGLGTQPPPVAPASFGPVSYLKVDP